MLEHQYGRSHHLERDTQLGHELEPWREEPQRHGQARRHWLRPAAWGVYLLSLAAASLNVADHPEWNLDGVFYSALMQPPAGSIKALHERVYAQIAEQIPKTSAAALTKGSRYRRQLRRSAEVFAAQLPFYTSKPLYCWLGRLLTATGVSSISAPYAISTACFGLIGTLLPLLAVRAGARPVVAAVVATLAVWLPQVRELGALATPDALTTALIVCGAILSWSDIRIAAAPLAAAVLARPDAAILVLGVLIAVWLRNPIRSRLRELLAVALLTCVLAALVLELTHAYGWSTVMRHTFIESVVDETGRHRSLSVRDYFESLGRGLRGHMTNHAASFLPYLGGAAAGYFAYVKRGRDQLLRAPVLLLAGVWGATLVRFLMLPLLADRLFAPAYVYTLALACAPDRSA